MIKSIYKAKSPEETMQLGERLAKKLKASDTVLLYGDLGAGKTHFTKGLAQGLGIEEKIKSPTYTYVNKYQEVGSRKQEIDLYHYDLYRLNEGDDLTSIGFWESIEDENAINIVEWADRISGQALHQIENQVVVCISEIKEGREIEIKFSRPTILTESEIENYYTEWATPMHVRDHCKTVTNVAMQIAQSYTAVGEVVNFELLYTACMLHDMNRICDFKELNRDKFFEEITDEKWQRWLDLRNQFKGAHHSEIAHDIFMERGYIETAKVIQAHRSDYLITKPELFDCLEKKIIYYADKRAKHDTIVDVKERYRDGKERYQKFSNPEKEKLFEQVEQATYKLEEELFSPLKISPNEIR